jgi:hypothetical protein
MEPDSTLVDKVQTLEGYGYTVEHGRLWVWDPDEGHWRPTEVRAERVRLGADDHPYVLTGSGLVIRVPPRQSTGIISASADKAGLIELPETASEIAVSPQGSVAYVPKSGQLGEFAFIDTSRLSEYTKPNVGIMPAATHLAADRIPIPDASRITAMVFDENGDVYVRDDSDQFFAGRRTDADNWTFQLLSWRGLRWEQVPERLHPWLVEGIQTHDSGALNPYSQFGPVPQENNLNVFGARIPPPRLLRHRSRSSPRQAASSWFRERATREFWEGHRKRLKEGLANRVYDLKPKGKERHRQLQIQEADIAQHDRLSELGVLPSLSGPGQRPLGRNPPLPGSQGNVSLAKTIADLYVQHALALGSSAARDPVGQVLKELLAAKESFSAPSLGADSRSTELIEQLVSRQSLSRLVSNVPGLELPAEDLPNSIESISYTPEPGSAELGPEKLAAAKQTIAQIVADLNVACGDPRAPGTRAVEGHTNLANVTETLVRRVLELKQGETLKDVETRLAGIDGDGGPPVIGIFTLWSGITRFLRRVHLPYLTLNFRWTGTGARTRRPALAITKTEEGWVVTAGYARGKEMSLISFNLSLGVGLDLGADIGWVRRSMTQVSRLPGMSWLQKVVAGFFSGIEIHPTIGKMRETQTEVSFKVPRGDRAQQFFHDLFQGLHEGNLKASRVLEQASISGVTIKQGETEMFMKTLPFNYLPWVFAFTHPWSLGKSVWVLAYVLQASRGRTRVTGSAYVEGPEGTVEEVINLTDAATVLNRIGVNEIQAADPYLLFGLAQGVLNKNAFWEPKLHPRVGLKTTELNFARLRWRLKRKLRLASATKKPVSADKSAIEGKPAINGSFRIRRDPASTTITEVTVEVHTRNPFMDIGGRFTRPHPVGYEHYTPATVGDELLELQNTLPESIPVIKKINESGMSVTTLKELKPELLEILNAYQSGHDFMGMIASRDLDINDQIHRTVLSLVERDRTKEGATELAAALMSVPQARRIRKIVVEQNRMFPVGFFRGDFWWRQRSRFEHTYKAVVFEAEIKYQAEGTKLVTRGNLKGETLKPRFGPTTTDHEALIRLSTSPNPVSSENKWLAELTGTAGLPRDEPFLKALDWSPDPKEMTAGQVMLKNGALVYRATTGRTIDVPVELQNELEDCFRAPLHRAMLLGENKILYDRGCVLTGEVYQYLEDQAARSESDVPEAITPEIAADPELPLSIAGKIMLLHHASEPEFDRLMQNPGIISFCDRLFGDHDPDRVRRLVGEPGEPYSPAPDGYLRSLKLLEDPVIEGDLGRELLAELIATANPNDLTNSEKLLARSGWPPESGEPRVQVGFVNGFAVFTTPAGETRDLPDEMVEFLFKKYPASWFLMLYRKSGIVAPEYVPKGFYRELSDLASRSSPETGRRYFAATVATPEPFEFPFPIEKFMEAVANRSADNKVNPGLDYFARTFGGWPELRRYTKDPLTLKQFVDAIRWRADPVALAMARNNSLKSVASSTAVAGASKEALREEQSLPGGNESRLGLLHGQPVFWLSADWPIDLPPKIIDELVGRWGLPLLNEMNEGRTRLLPPLGDEASSQAKAWGLDQEQTQLLFQFVRSHGGKRAHDGRGHDGSNRSLFVNDILDGLLSGETLTLNPAQVWILSQFFPDTDGGLHWQQFKEFLEDPIRVSMLQRAINRILLNYRREAGQVSGIRAEAMLKIPRGRHARRDPTRQAPGRHRNSGAEFAAGQEDAQRVNQLLGTDFDELRDLSQLSDPQINRLRSRGFFQTKPRHGRGGTIRR